MTSRPSRRVLVLALLVAAVTVGGFWPALDGQFLNWDDDENFLRNESYRGPGPAQVWWMFTTSLMGHYIPLTWVTFGLNCALGGLAPRGYLAVNVFLHALAAVLWFLVARRLLTAASPGRGLSARWIWGRPSRPSSLPCIPSASSRWCGSPSGATC
jgi:hypothetical protein